MIRILHVVFVMGQGGIENFLMNIYRNIDKSKIQFDFLAHGKGVFDEEIKQLGGKIYYINKFQDVGQFKYVKELDDFLFKHKGEYKIIHSHFGQLSGLILERANKFNYPIRIAHSHNNKYVKNIAKKIYKMFLGIKLNKNANIKLACSKQAGEFLYGKKEKFLVINNCIDADKFLYNEEIRKKVRENLNIDENCFLIGNVARFNKQKNHIFLINLFNEFIKIYPNSKLLLIGNGELKGKILNIIIKKRLKDKIIMLENRKDVNELMQAMDFFVLPSIFEGLGIVLIEAQAAGLKCIASSNVIPKESKVTPLLEFYSLKNSPKKWAEEIYIQKEYKRKNTIKEIRNSGYDIKTSVKDIEKLYLEFEKNLDKKDGGSNDF